MPDDPTSDPQAPLCRPHIDAAGLPQRGAVILERERHLYALLRDRLHGQRVERETPDLEPVACAELGAALAARDGITLPPAAWLAGRCQPDTPADQAELTGQVRAVVAALRGADLDVLAWGYIEAAFALALRGDPDSAHQALAALVRDAPEAMDTYLAAFYLAQLGDPGGWPALQAALHSASSHTRLMAVRHLVAFLPYDGQRVGTTAIDVRGALVQRLNDHDPLVRAEVPYHLAEAGIPDLRALLAPLVHDPDATVRLMAEAALRQAPDTPAQAAESR